MTIASIRNGDCTPQRHRHSMRRTVSDVSSINRSPGANMQHAASTVFKRTLLSVVLSATMLPPVFAAGLTRDNGSPVGDNQNSETAGPEGPVLLQDSHLVKNCSVSIASVFPNGSFMRAEQVPLATSFQAP